MPSDAICVLHTQIPREPRTEPNEPRFRKILLGLVSVYWLLISVRSRSRPRSKKPDRYRFEPPNRYRAPSSLGSFAGLALTVYVAIRDIYDIDNLRFSTAFTLYIRQLANWTKHHNWSSIISYFISHFDKYQTSSVPRVWM